MPSRHKTLTTTNILNGFTIKLSGSRDAGVHGAPADKPIFSSTRTYHAFKREP
jgi:hypothetical protein